MTFLLQLQPKWTERETETRVLELLNWKLNVTKAQENALHI